MVASRPPPRTAKHRHMLQPLASSEEPGRKKNTEEKSARPPPLFHAPFLDLLEELQKCSDPLSSFAGRDREAGDSLIRLLQIGHIVHIIFVLLTVHTDPFTKTL
jgi:hypothetical protein